MIPPPPYVVFLADRYFPGIWQFFMRAAPQGLRSATAGTSWYRTPDRNRDLGSPDSQHLAGLAFDVVGPDLSRLGADLRAAGFRVVDYPGHVHAQVLPASLARRSGLLDALGA